MVGCQGVQILSMYLFPQVPKGMMTSGKLAYFPHELQGPSRWTFMVNGSWNRVSASHQGVL